jgi:hypothetical protein
VRCDVIGTCALPSSELLLSISTSAEIAPAASTAAAFVTKSDILQRHNNKHAYAGIQVIVLHI